MPRRFRSLNDAASGDITFAGGSTFANSVTATTTAGFIASDLGSSLTLTGGASNLSLTATGHDILMKGAVSIGGTTALAANVIAIDNAANDFTGALQLNGLTAGSVVDANDLNLAASTINLGNLLQTVAIKAGGNITQSGALTVTNFGTLAISSTGGSITLTNAANVFSSGGSTDVRLAVSVTGANTASVVSSTPVLLGDLRLDNGTFSLSANGFIFQALGTTIQTDGALALTINGGANRDIVLDKVGNHIGGAVTIAESGGGDVRDVSIRNADDNATAPTGTPLTTAGDVRNLTLFFDNNGIALPGYNISNNLSVTAGGEITQTAPLTIAGTTTLTILGDHGIALTNVANAFSGAVSLNAPQSTQAVQIVDTSGLNIGTSDLGRGAFEATAVTGNITQSGSGIVLEKGAAPATFTVTAGNTITLSNSANRFTGSMVLAGAGLTTVNVRNADFMTKFSDLTLPATVTDLTVRFNNASIALPTLNLANLNINALGIAQVTGSSIVATTASFTANAFALNLSNTGNDFTDLAVNNSGRNDVSVVDLDDLNFSGNSTLGTGRLTVTAGGNITQANRITQANAGPAGEVSFTSTGGSVTLTNASNNFIGPFSVAVSAANTATVTNAGFALTLGQVTTGSGAFTATAGSQGIVQDPNSVLNLGGASSFTATGGGTITLLNKTNTFAGTIALSAANASIRDTGPVVLAASNVTSTLSVKSGGTAADSITQSGAITGNSAATFDAGAGSVTLTTATNNFNSVSVFSTGASVAITDTNALNVGTIRVGGGTLTLTTGGNLDIVGGTSGIVQTTGAGAITLDTPGANNISLLSEVNVLHSTNVSLQSQGDLTLVGSSAVSGFLKVISGGVLTLPASLNVTGLSASAVSTTIGSDITAGATGISLTGTVTLTGNRVLTSGAGIDFNGDLNVGGSLTLNLPANEIVLLALGTWTQGANPLTINGSSADLEIGDGSGSLARFQMTSGTIVMPGGGDVTVTNGGTFLVGATSSPETVTIANGAGALSINGTLAVGFGATNDLLIKSGSGLVSVLNESHFIGSGLAGASASPVLASETALIVGRFPGSVDASDAPHDFFAGSDIVTPAYDFTQLTVKAGGTLAPTGTITGFLPDGDRYTVTSSLGATAGLTIVEDLAGMLDIVVRNNTATGASTLTITTTGGGDGQLPIGGVMVHAPGAVSVVAATSNFTGMLTTVGALKSLTARDLGAPGTPLVVSGGGAASDTTSITARVVENTTATLADVLGSFKAVSATSVNLTAQKFGTLATTGLLAANNLGDFNANLISTIVTTGTVVTSATVAGTLGGSWDVRGSVGKVTARAATGWELGTLAEANVRNGGLLSDAKSLTLGPVTDSAINATGAIGSLTTSDIDVSNFTAGSFGTVKVAGNLALGLVGNVASSTITATGNVAGIALKGLSIAGDLTASSLIFLDGDASAIAVARTVSTSPITATDTNGHGNLKSITAGKWSATNVDARTIGTFKITGNLPAGLFGDFSGSTVTLRGNNAGLGLATFDARGNVSASTFDVQNGNVTSLIVGRQLGSTSVKLADAAFGNLGTIQAADWAGGVSVLAKTIATVASVGAAAVAPASPLLLGGIVGDTITAYLNTGIVPAIAKLTAKGDLSGSTVNAERGIGSVAIGRNVASSFIIADDAVAGAANVGRIPTLTAGAWNGSTVSVNTFGKVQILGYAQPESSSASFQFGTVTNGTFLVHGATAAKPLGIDTFTVARDFTGSSLTAPFGIKTLTVLGGIEAGSKIVTDNPVTPASGSIATFTAGEIANSTVRAGSIGALKTTGSVPFALLGDIGTSTIAINAGTPLAGAVQALGALTVAGDFSGSVLDAPATVGKIEVLGRIAGSSVETRIQAGYAAGNKLGSITAGAWGQAGSNFTTDLVTQSVGTFTLKGNAARGFVGTTDRGVIDILGNAGGIGLGTFSATGTASDSLFRVSDGDVTSFTAQRLISSDLLVGYRFAKASDITAAPTAANWSATNHKIGTFKTTAAFDATDVTDSASFVDSNVIAGILGSITVSGVNPATLDSTAFGVAFRTSAGAAAAGVVKSDGSAVALTAPAISGQFNYLGLAG